MQVEIPFEMVEEVIKKELLELRNKALDAIRIDYHFDSAEDSIHRYMAADYLLRWYTTPEEYHVLILG